MNKKEEVILNLMKDDDYVPMKAKELAMILGVPKKDYNLSLIHISEPTRP